MKEQGDKVLVQGTVMILPHDEEYFAHAGYQKPYAIRFPSSRVHYEESQGKFFRVGVVDLVVPEGAAVSDDRMSEGDLSNLLNAAADEIEKLNGELELALRQGNRARVIIAGDTVEREQLFTKIGKLEEERERLRETLLSLCRNLCVDTAAAVLVVEELDQ